MVSGRIVDRDGDPIAKAQLTAYTQPMENYNPSLPAVLTDKDGRFEFASILPGRSYRLHLRSFEGNSQQNIIEFGPGSAEKLSLGDVVVD